MLSHSRNVVYISELRVYNGKQRVRDRTGDVLNERRPVICLFRHLLTTPTYILSPQ